MEICYMEVMLPVPTSNPNGDYGPEEMFELLRASYPDGSMGYFWTDEDTPFDPWLEEEDPGATVAPYCHPGFRACMRNGLWLCGGHLVR